MWGRGGEEVSWGKSAGRKRATSSSWSQSEVTEWKSEWLRWGPGLLQGGGQAAGLRIPAAAPRQRGTFRGAGLCCFLGLHGFSAKGSGSTALLLTQVSLEQVWVRGSRVPGTCCSACAPNAWPGGPVGVGVDIVVPTS